MSDWAEQQQKRAGTYYRNLAIKILYSIGIRQKELVFMFSLDRKRIHQIIKNKTPQIGEQYNAPNRRN